ncbi:zinc-binding dehydrogenase [Mesorhizobium sp. M0955]|uniref:zinc-binding dehydrogenase n=1 Tax=Mesorhizobium sp. M0955 TaxID=2957033 RepID=UPI0033358C84
MTANKMTAVHLVGHGGLDKLVVRDDVAVRQPGPGDVLVNVTAAGMNNTDINTRTGWYNKQVSSGTTAEGGKSGFGVAEKGMGDWEGGLTFPRIQGADAVGYVLAVGEGVDASRIGERVVCDPYIRDPEDVEGFDSAGFLGSEHDGAFAQFTTVPSVNAVSVPKEFPLSNAALAPLPCSGGTAMNMLSMAGAKAGDLALVTGASGGVGTFLVQILKALGATAIAVTGKSKMAAVCELGADHVIDRDTPDLSARCWRSRAAGSLASLQTWSAATSSADLLKLLRRGGRYVTAGAIGGPKVDLDLRTLYLKNLSLFGSTVYLRDTFTRLIDLVVAGRIKPFNTKSWPLDQIHAAQSEFSRRRTSAASSSYLPKWRCKGEDHQTRGLPGRSRQVGHRNPLHPCLSTPLEANVLRIDTDEELIGWGETITPPSYYLPTSARAGLDLIAPMLLGADPLNHRARVEEIAFAMRAHKPTKSVVDMALWDLVGKARGPIMEWRA